MDYQDITFIVIIFLIVSIVAFIFFSEKLDRSPEKCFNSYGHYIDCQYQRDLMLAQASAPILPTYNIIIDDPKQLKDILEKSDYNITFNKK